MANNDRLLIFFLLFLLCKCWAQSGPDPWNYGDNELPKHANNEDIPPDLQIHPKKIQTDNSLGHGEWFFRRMLSIVMKGGQIKKNDDGSVDISLQLRLDTNQWNTLDGYLISTSAFTEDMYRRSVGYIEHSIYKPSIGEKIVMAWTDYVQKYLEENKTYVTYSLAALATLGLIIWLWHNMSHRHFTVIIFLLLYLYEVFTSYKEAEKQDVDRFLAAVNSCKWYFWASSCEVPKPDPLIFIKHMNPLKIGIRMFTTIISEPLITLSDTLKTMVNGISDGLWYPFDRIVYGILIVSFNVLLLFLFIMVLFNYIFNIPIDLSYLGIVSLHLKQRTRTLFAGSDDNTSNNNPSIRNNDTGNVDRISGPTLNRMLDVFQALTAHTATQNNSDNAQRRITNFENSGIRRSSSTGRLTDLSNKAKYSFPIKKRNVNIDGSGDAH